ncbi:hypothetical protein SAMN05421636_106164 [Pricia antarctica]|uniref:Uncharacterized protein n=1 Tax=Pricia antarctica TaxID=641691 RepID=A0A1G7EF55_9FLAO|nr:hypothetical protein SAMN05421636_106164 [Pricia antarctica]
MEEIYFDIQGNCRLIKASKPGVDFLLAYSKSLQMTEVGGAYFETHLN